MRLPPPDTVRGRIKRWLAAQAGDLHGPVLEVGAKHDGNWWCDNRDLRPDLAWFGIDVQPGQGVDLVANAQSMPGIGSGTYGSAICSEVLEHTWSPSKMLGEIRRVCRPGSVVLITTLFAFPFHGFPDDYWRFSRTCLARLMSEAGLDRVIVEEEGEILVELRDHDESVARRTIPIHVFAKGTV